MIKLFISFFVTPMGLEPMTPSLKVTYSSHLSYGVIHILGVQWDSNPRCVVNRIRTTI